MIRSRLKNALRALNDDVQELRREAARADGEDGEALHEELAAFEPFRQLRLKRILRELVALEGRREPAGTTDCVRPPIADIRRMAPEIARPGAWFRSGPGHHGGGVLPDGGRGHPGCCLGRGGTKRRR